MPSQLPATGRDRVPRDLYADREGNVYRRDLDGWQQHTREGWKPATERPTGGGGTMPPGSRPAAPSQQPNYDLRPPGSVTAPGTTRPVPSQPVQPPGSTDRPPGSMQPSQRPSYSPQVPTSRPPSISTRPAPSQPSSTISDLNRQQRARQHGNQLQQSSRSRSISSGSRSAAPSARPAPSRSGGGARTGRAR